MTQRDSSDAKNTATGAISSGCPVRPSGVRAINCFSKSLPITPAACVPSVSTPPGLIALTRIFRGPSSFASTRVTGRLRLPPARRDVFGGDGDGLEAGFGDRKRRGGRAQGFEADLLQGPLELDAILRGALAGLEFVQDGFGTVDEAFVVDDRGVEGRDEFEKVGLAFEEVGEEIGILGQGTELVGSVCLASSPWLSAQRGSRFMNISRRGGAGQVLQCPQRAGIQ